MPCRKLIALLSVWIAYGCASSRAEAPADAYASEFTQCQSMRFDEHSRDSIVQAWEDLIARHPGDERNVQAMLFVSHLYTDYSQPEFGVAPDRSAGDAWTQRAIRAARAGSGGWVEAKFRDCDAMTSPAAALRTLDAIEGTTQSLLIAIRASKARVARRVAMKNIDAALSEYRRAIQRDDDMERMIAGGRLTAEKAERNKVLSFERGMTSFIVSAIGSDPDMPESRRIAMLQDLLRAFPGNPALNWDANLEISWIRRPAALKSIPYGTMVD